MTQEFKPKGSVYNPDLAAQVAREYTKRKQSLTQGLENGTSQLEIGKIYSINKVKPFPQHFGETCFVAAVVACSSVIQEGAAAAQNAEGDLRSTLAKAQLINPQGVLTVGNEGKLNEVFSNRLKVKVAKYPAQQMSEFALGENVAGLIQKEMPLLICFEVREGTQAGHWIVLSGVKRENEATASWKLMDPALGSYREIQTAELARYIVGNPGFVPQLFTVEGEQSVMFRPKNIRPVFIPKNS
jgi:hypothetical protein